MMPLCVRGCRGRIFCALAAGGLCDGSGQAGHVAAETMAMTGHHSVATVMGYFRAESSLNSKASRMLDED